MMYPYDPEKAEPVGATISLAWIVVFAIWLWA